MNINDNVLDAELFLPDGRKFHGRLIFDVQYHIVEFNENPNGRMSTQTLPVVFCKAENKNYTLVHCICSKVNLKKSSYVINELYEGDFINPGLEKDYLSLTVTILSLTNWLKMDIFSLKNSDPQDYYFSLKAHPNKKHKITYEKNKHLMFEGGSEVKMDRNEISILKKSSLSVVSESPISRQELFQNYFSFLNLYSLFLRKLPETSSLSFKKESSELKLLLYPIEDKNERLSDILISFDKLTAFQEIVSRYFENRLKFDQIIPLWEASMKERLDPEIVFLHLTQSIELFHKCFFEKSSFLKEIGSEIVKEFNLRYKNLPDKWLQIMRYYHLYKITEEIGLKVPFSKEKADFILHLLDSRNFYTHHDEKEFIWSHFELYSINNILRVWMRGLLLNQLQLSISDIQRCINADFYNSMDIDVFKNPFSMRYWDSNNPINSAIFASL